MSQYFPTRPQLIPLQNGWICTFCGKDFSSVRERDFHMVVDCASGPSPNIDKTQAAQIGNQPSEKTHTTLQCNLPPPRFASLNLPYLPSMQTPTYFDLPSPQFRGYRPLHMPEWQELEEIPGAEGLIQNTKLRRTAMESSEETASVAEVDTELCRVMLEGGSLGGYRCDILIENISGREVNTYKCARCRGIMKDCSISNKGEQLCVCCLKEGENSLSNESIRVTISSLKCSCPLSKRGCDWLGRLGNVEQHLTTCCLVNVSCDFKCKLVTTRGKMRRHLKEVCPQRPVPCLHCSEVHKAWGMELHVNVCGKVEVLCELGCGKLLPRDSMKLHKEIECLEGTVVCPYAKYNCEVTGIKRRELTQHLQNSRITHLELKVNILGEENLLKLQELEDRTNLKIFTLEKDNASLKKKLEEFGKQIVTKNQEIKFLKEEVQVKEEGTVKWNIKNISNHFKAKSRSAARDLTYSNFFVVVSYKFRLCHSCDNQDFKIGFRLTKTYFHDYLKWPLNVIFLTRIVHQRDPKKSINNKSSMHEINKEDYANDIPRQVCSIPLSTDLKDFVRSDSLDVEVTIRILKH